MPTLVQKYGGSSVADIDRLKRVARKIVETRRSGYDLVVVVSAMGDTTDELLDTARQITATPSRRELDMLLSVGERISMALLSMAIQQEGLEAISLTGSQCGIITTSSHSNARIIDVRPFRIQDELDQGRIVIVAGYQGTSYKREVTTLGRGGSDTTAVALAAALGAEACEIYSDVDGVFSADPRVVLDAHKLESLSHDEMMEMARAGARVLNEQAVEFARRAQIALYARSTHLPESRGTIVRPDGFSARAEHAERGALEAVAVSHISRGLFIQAPDQVATLAALDLLDACDIAASAPLPSGGMRALLSTENIHDIKRLCDELLGLELGITCSEDFGMISVIGQGVGSNARAIATGWRALDALSTPPLLLCAHPARPSWALPSELVEQATRLLHQAYLSAP